MTGISSPVEGILRVSIGAGEVAIVVAGCAAARSDAKTQAAAAAAEWLRNVRREIIIGISLLPAQSDRAGGRVGFDVAETHVPVHDPQLVGDASAFAAEADARLAAGFFEDLDVRPGDPAAPAGPEHLQHGFLGGESAGEVF